MVRKFKEDLQDGIKILVYKHNPPLSDSMSAELVKAIRRHGTNPVLLVEISKTLEEVGKVINCGNGSFKGYVDRFSSPEKAQEFSYWAWMKLVKNFQENKDFINYRDLQQNNI